MYAPYSISFDYHANKLGIAYVDEIWIVPRDEERRTEHSVRRLLYSAYGTYGTAVKKKWTINPGDEPNTFEFVETDEPIEPMRTLDLPPR
jgi:hypothetical protein